MTEEVLADAEAAARRGAELIAEAARRTIADRGTRSRSRSAAATRPGGCSSCSASTTSTGRAIDVFQVDERIAPAGDPDRNLTHLLESLPADGVARVRPMPVNDDDLEAAAARYADELPGALDLVHLGLGPDGHTASLVPGDPVLEVTDRRVAITGEYQGRRRMTLTYPAIEAAGEVLWLVTGADKPEGAGEAARRRPVDPGRAGAGPRTRR